MITEDIQRCLEVLRQSGIILYPTDTVWGIGCDATNASAVEKIYALKKRSDQKSMIILIDNENKLMSYVREVPPNAYDLMDFAERPLTIIYPGARNLAANAVSQDGTVGIRVTKDSFCRQLIERFKKPIISTSANISGEASPATFSQINSEIIAGVDYVVEHRQKENTSVQPSTIIQLGLGGEIKIIRK